MSAVIYPSEEPLFKELCALERTLTRASVRGDPLSSAANQIAEVVSAAFVAKTDFQRLRDKIIWGEYDALTLTQVEEWMSLHTKLLRESELCCGFPHIKAMVKDLSAQIDGDPNIDPRLQQRLKRRLNRVDELLEYAYRDAQLTLTQVYWEEWVIANHKGISLQVSAPLADN